MTALRRWWRWPLCLVGWHPRGSVAVVKSLPDLFIVRKNGRFPLTHWCCNNCGREWLGGAKDHLIREK